TQFLPSSYIAFAVDFDGDGRRDLQRSTADVLASTANFLRGHGWQPGQSWEEGSGNYQVILQWNKAQVYAKTVGEFARQLSEG
nr:lytic murein transglycosylase [Hyphomicrobiales bacterium]